MAFLPKRAKIVDSDIFQSFVCSATETRTSIFCCLGLGGLGVIHGVYQLVNRLEI